MVVLSNKEKLLESAQKFLAKGQIARAIKDYQKVVELDPKDIRSRQKLAELYSRARMIPEAVDALEGIAKYYTDNGFYLKAIAVYKQMQRLDPARPVIYLRLAELNGKQGLVGNALAEYRTLVGYYEKSGMIPEAVNVLQKMRDLEPENLNIRVKIIETHLQAGSPDNARSEFADTVALLEPKRDFVRLQKIYDFFLPKFPEDPQMRIGLARVLIRKGEPARGIELLNGVLSARPGDESILRLLADGYRAAEEFARERKIYEQLLRNRPDDLDLRSEAVRARLDAGEFRPALDELEKLKEVFQQGQRLPVLKGFYERLGQELPGEERVIATLRSIYEMTGEGGKLFDMISAAPGNEGASGHVEIAADEIFTDSVLEDAVRDAEGIDEVEPVLRGRKEDDAYSHEHAEEIPLEFLEGTDLVDTPPAVAETPQTESLPELELEMELELDLHFDIPQSSADVEPAPAFEEIAALTAVGIELPDGDIPGFFDLRAAVLDGEGENGGEKPADEPEIPLDEIPVKAKKGIKTEVEVEDPESHYNLGIAYKEMGLLDDAVIEFDKAMGEPSLAVACLTLKGICLVEKGALARAEETFRSALERPGLTDAERMGLHYELGLLYEGCNRPKEALDNFQEVAVTDLFFRNAGEKVRVLRRQLEQDGSREEEDGGRRKDRVSYV